MNFFLLVLIIMAVYMSIKDYKVIKRHRSFKTYSPLVEHVYNDSSDDFIPLADEYIKNEPLKEFQNKARILKFFSLVKDNKDNYQDTLADIDLNCILLDEKGRIDKTKEMLNSDSFFWFLLSSILADIHQNEELKKTLLNKIESYNDTLGNELYLKMSEAYLKISADDSESLSLFKRILSGDYYEYRYAKDLISIFKKLSAAILVFKGEEIEELDEHMLHDFTKGQAGSFILKEMNLYDLYADAAVEGNE